MSQSSTAPDHHRLSSLDKTWDDDDQFLLGFASRTGSSALQIACGTGALAHELSKNGVEVVGVDRNPRKIAQAIKRTRAVTWVGADARTIRLNRRFDTVVISGNAFHAFTTDTDQVLLLETVTEHLKSGGRFAFGMQNPSARPWESWPQHERPMRVRSADGEDVAFWQDFDGPDTNGLVSMKTHYDSHGERCSLNKQRRFVPKDHLVNLFKAVDLEPAAWYGDWSGAEAAEGSPYIIVTGRKY
ncbi:class I SAM-dependent methyltransferase [Pseudovibrio sp. SPO723]|uniref:class I SAM-dependent methyltransferase n=1 Tax=Nesiotobacter zosterae TaxID=392721 RepID=UPI0029C10546|nr:class I SAM-dependent methyltransferase [Pseudovibrio sp. SPO723]MDX5593113.1 class I SAM-dependent methyltransferase [Pseudovibrio sp. SPO723]